MNWRYIRSSYGSWWGRFGVQQGDWNYNHQELVFSQGKCIEIGFSECTQQYLVLQGAEYKCSETDSLLSLLFTTWDPYTPFFGNLVPMLAQKKDMPKVKIINTRKMINKVKYLNRFFARKLQLIQNKMKEITTRTSSFVPIILDNDGGFKD